ncbi:hypothetical protein QEZ54_09205 [Catellatospora sp. KI3]|uniref:hypothetical protein n=1 Tax=Catellatospora sp. KI3 TaxID=3041620 RepID=UPI002482D6BB|nr:hypothetical protein [Catellatospora sp. KI3]MDI1461141.1 hypothetical protein [Catellatospora sp. KI3]
MLDAIELWQVPLLVAGVILVGFLVYAFIANRASRITALWIKIVGLVALGLLVLVLFYQLIKREELPVVTSLVAIAIDLFVGWVATQELRELRLARKEREQQHPPA